MGPMVVVAPAILPVAPAFAGTFTKQYQQYAAFVKKQNNLGVKAPLNP